MNVYLVGLHYRQTSGFTVRVCAVSHMMARIKAKEAYPGAFVDSCRQIG